MSSLLLQLDESLTIVTPLLPLFPRRFEDLLSRSIPGAIAIMGIFLIDASLGLSLLDFYEAPEELFSVQCWLAGASAAIRLRSSSSIDATLPGQKIVGKGLSR